MPEHTENLLHWLHIFLVIAAICSTGYVVSYAFFPWYKSIMGRVLMLKATALALAMDLTTLFQYWQPHNIIVIFWVQLVVFGMIALGTGFSMMLVLNAQFRKQSSLPKEGKYDGTIDVTTTKTGGKSFLLNLENDPDDLDSKTEVRFKINRTKENA